MLIKSGIAITDDCLVSGTFPNISRNAIINVAEIVCYDVVKSMILRRNIMEDNIPCHFTSAVFAGEIHMY